MSAAGGSCGHNAPWFIAAVCRFCCKSLFAQVTKNSPGRRRDVRVKMWGTSSPDHKLTGDLGNGTEATKIGGCGSDCLIAGNLVPSNFGVLQQYLRRVRTLVRESGMRLNAMRLAAAPRTASWHWHHAAPPPHPCDRRATRHRLRQKVERRTTGADQGCSSADTCLPARRLPATHCRAAGRRRVNHAAVRQACAQAQASVLQSHAFVADEDVA